MLIPSLLLCIWHFPSFHTHFFQLTLMCLIKSRVDPQHCDEKLLLRFIVNRLLSIFKYDKRDFCRIFCISVCLYPCFSFRRKNLNFHDAVNYFSSTNNALRCFLCHACAFNSQLYSCALKFE